MHFVDVGIDGLDVEESMRPVKDEVLYQHEEDLGQDEGLYRGQILHSH